jgi:hypothetical protein
MRATELGSGVVMDPV